MGHPPEAEVVILRTVHRRGAPWIALLSLVASAPLGAQEPPDPSPLPSAAHASIEPIARGYADTPNGLGLLPTARAEAETAIQHAELAQADSLSLDGMKRHADHVLNALDPALAPSGPGLGYGVRRAAEGVLEHIQRADAAEDASDNLRTHAEHIAGAARSALERVERAVTLASRLRSASTASEASSLARELATTTRAVWLGQDADRDGRISWSSPEGGLRQVQLHMTLLRRGEGLDQEGFGR